jgi:tRNA dimethylallyltransferase
MYRGMDIGTAKPTDTTRYELLNLKNPDEEFGVGEYVLLAAARLQEHFNNNVNVVLCGGTGLYIRALIEEYQDLSPAPSPELRRELNERPEDE